MNKEDAISRKLDAIIATLRELSKDPILNHWVREDMRKALRKSEGDD